MSRVGTNAMTGVLVRKQTHTERWGRKPCEDRSRDWSVASTR